MLFCGQFSIIANAGSENLIDSDLRNWENISDINDLYSPITVTYYSKPNVYRLTANGTESGIFAGILFDNTEIISGHNYTLQFEIPSGEYLTSNGYSITDDSIKWHYHSAHVTVSLGFIQSDGSIYEDETTPYLQFSADNISQNLGKVCSLTFEADKFTGTPCIAISITNIDNQNQNRIFFFKDFSLVDNSQAEEDGFFARLFAWFQEKFDAIGESFSNLGSKLTDLKNSFVNKLTDLKDSFINIGNDIIQGLTDLKNDLINGIKSLFVPDEDFMDEYSNRWDELIHTRLGAVAQVSGVLHDFFDSILAYSGSEQNTISVPAVTLPLPDNASFTFGGFDVEIVNEKFVFLQNAVKVLVGILSTFAFIYGLRKRYDEVMEVEQ